MQQNINYQMENNNKSVNFNFPFNSLISIFNSDASY